MDRLEQYLQRIEEGKNYPLVAQIIEAQKKYVSERVNLQDGEAITQLVIKTIREMSGFDLERLVLHPHLIASTYEKAREEGLGGRDLTHQLRARYKGDYYICEEATAEVVFLAYVTMGLGEVQGQFLDNYLSRESIGDFNVFVNPEDHAPIRWKYVDGEQISETLENLAFVKYPEEYKKAFEQAQKLRKASGEFKMSEFSISLHSETTISLGHQ